MERILIIFLCAIYAHPAWQVRSLAEIKNEAVVRQKYELSCGAAAVATLINFSNKNKLKEVDILKIINNKNMLTFSDLSIVLDRFNFKNSSYKISQDNFNKLINIPIITRIKREKNYPHFVVIINYEGDFLRIFDPNFGEYLSSKKNFFKFWDEGDGGYILLADLKNNLENLDLKLPFNFIKSFELWNNF